MEPDELFSPRVPPSEASSWQTSGDAYAQYARDIGSRLAGEQALPQGWVAVHAGGETYYHHDATGGSQWERPSEAVRELSGLGVEDVGVLLRCLGMEALAAGFASHFVDGAALAQMGAPPR